LLVVEPDYLLDSDVCFIHAWTPFPNGGVWGVGGISPSQISPGGSKGGGDNFCSPPLVGDSGKTPPKRNIGKKCLVKYCNFVVNMDRSL
jgi:hypothetical protein